MSDSRRHTTVIPASCTIRSAPRDRRARLLASSAISGGTLRGLALAAGVSIAATALWAVPARAQQALNGGTATGPNAYASGTGATATGNAATATGEFSTANGVGATAAPAVAGPKHRDPFGSYAADLPLTYKAPIAEARGLFRIWAEGGAIWTGGDPISQDFALTDFTKSFPLFGGLLGNSTIPGSFNLTPKIGWEAATGFDYRFADSPWHVSGQFRYGEGGKTSGVASAAGTLNPALLALLPGGAGPFAGAVIGGSETFAASYKETHWLADIAVGRDVFGTGPSAMQVMGGLRIAEFLTNRRTSDNLNVFVNFAAPVQIFGPTGPFVSAINVTNSTVTDERNSFLGAGPRIGVEGSVPFAGHWAFDYLGDAALLFGTQKSLNTSTTIVSVSPAILSILGGSGSTTSRSERFATIFNADIQVGVSYWLTQNLKLSAGYRLDAFINVQNQESTAVTNLTPDRYTHGPRVAVSGQF
jgi:Legionella pneumophila major outer membrane protein precursor